MTATLEPGLPESYYAPEFLLEVEGTVLDPASKGDVLELKVELDLNQLDRVEIKLNNYDDTAFDLKWSDSDLFELGNRVHVQMGYADRLVSMLSGPITSLSPDFPADGVPTLTVSAMEPLVRLKGSKPPQDAVTYEEKADWQIAKEVAQRHDLRIEVTEDGPEHPLVVQRNVDDAVFLKERAARIDFDVFMRTDPDTGDDVLYFIAPTDERSAGSIHTYALAWGSLRNTDTPPSLIEFKPTITAADQIQSVTVRGWDPEIKEPIEYTAKPTTTPGVTGDQSATGPAAAARIAGEDARQETVVDAPVASVEEAQRLAEALLAERAYEFLTGHGKAIGLPDLRPGDNVEIDGLGERFSGMYYVTKTTHSLDSRGLLTEFDVRKTYEGKIP
jgi:uncharacterized protein